MSSSTNPSNASFGSDDAPVIVAATNKVRLTVNSSSYQFLGDLTAIKFQLYQVIGLTRYYRTNMSTKNF
jgi:hypothetical protein